MPRHEGLRSGPAPFRSSPRIPICGGTPKSTDRPAAISPKRITAVTSRVGLARFVPDQAGITQPALRGHSIDSLVDTSERCQQPGITAVVSHPGNYTDHRGPAWRSAEGCTTSRTRPQIGEGALGPEPFRCVLRNQRFVNVIEILEAPRRRRRVRLQTAPLTPATTRHHLYAPCELHCS